MGLTCGIVGLPNVGKSTLFNALTETVAAEAANYPFCTIEPNNGIVFVPDTRLEKLSKIAGSAKTIPAFIEFVDIAGLVKGASQGEGLGNKFLSHIREVDAILHVTRCFEDQNITHVHDRIDPISDIEIINTELILADLESLENRIPKMLKKIKSGEKNLKPLLDKAEEIIETLKKGDFPKYNKSDKEEVTLVKQLQLITTKPILFICNVAEEDVNSGNKLSDEVVKYAENEGSQHVIISSKIEEEVANLANAEEKKEFIEALGLETTGLSKIITASYKLLDLESFFTVGPKEAHAWTIKKNTKAPAAAGVIHSDFEKGFIRAEVTSYQDYTTLNGEQGAKEQGKLRLEGKDYLVQDGDIIHFRFNV